jgi:glycosyltransferase involved in cell wall biosynthesis
MDVLISVIIPAYNIENYIAGTLDSVLAQTYRNLQIIVVNDGSKDGTGNVIDEYAKVDSRIKVIHKENGGVTSARLRGLAEADGQYIGFVDGDDYIEPDMYERLMENMNIHQADISHCGYQMVFPTGRVDYYHNTGKLLLQKEDQGCADILDGSVMEPGLWNKLYRKELFEGLTDWMDLTIRINEDLLMNFYLFRKVRLAVFEDVCAYHYVLRPGSAATSGISEHKLKDPLKVMHRLYRETLDCPNWNSIVQRRLMYQLVNSATISLGNQKELIKPFRKEARKELRQRLWKTLRGTACGSKLKVMVLWVAIWPWSYSTVHRIYAKVTGVDKKYAVE